MGWSHILSLFIFTMGTGRFGKRKIILGRSLNILKTKSNITASSIGMQIGYSSFEVSHMLRGVKDIEYDIKHGVKHYRMKRL